MIIFKMPELKIGNLEVKTPIIQGGMGVGISLSGLASAVANEGGVGVIAANAIGMIDPDYYSNGREANIKALRSEIRKARHMSGGVIGVNIMVALNDFRDMLEVAISERVDIIFLGAGLPIKGIPVAKIREAGVKIAPIVSSRRAAELIFRYWEKSYGDIPDAVVVEGPLAGGHLGFKVEDLKSPEHALEKIVPEVIAGLVPFQKTFAKNIPVIAAGGIYSGQDIHRFLQLGAQGVQMATRFVATPECDADHRFKEAYLNCRAEDIIIIKSPVGLPGRAIHNSFLDRAAAGIRNVDRCAWRCLESCDIKNAVYCISAALDNARQGLLDKGFVFVGANAYRVNKIVPVRELVHSLKVEYEAALVRSFVTFKDEYLKTIEKGFLTLKSEYEKAARKFYQVKEDYTKAVEKKMGQVRGDYDKAVEKINLLKKDYEKVIEKINDLANRFPEKLSDLQAIVRRFQNEMTLLAQV